MEPCHPHNGICLIVIYNVPAAKRNKGSFPHLLIREMPKQIQWRK